VAIVAVAARGRISLPPRERQAMHTGTVAFGLLLVAPGAFRGLGRHIVIGMFNSNVAVATDAGIGPMNGRGQFGFVYKEPNRLADPVGLVESFVGVAVQTGAVLNLRAQGASNKEDQGAQGKPQAGKTITHDSRESAGVINFALPGLAIVSLFLREPTAR